MTQPAANTRRVSRLPDHEAEHLRSALVISSLTDLVLELVYNAIDAGATRVAVDMDLAAFQVTVKGDGAGCHPDDMDKIFLRHYSSKNATRAGETYGFRGEALASIAQIALVQITSKRATSPCAHRRIYGPNGALASSTLAPDVGAQGGTHGTVVQCTDIFHRIPVRRNLLVPAQEVNRVAASLELVAIMEPDVHVSLVDRAKGVTVLELPRAAGRVERLAQVLGGGEGVHRVDFERGPLRVHADVFKSPEALRLVYVNKRARSSGKLAKVVLDAILARHESPFDAVPMGFICDVRCDHDLADDETKLIDLLKASPSDASPDHDSAPAPIGTTPELLSPSGGGRPSAGPALFGISSSRSFRERVPKSRRMVKSLESTARRVDSGVHVDPRSGNSYWVGGSSSCGDSGKEARIDRSMLKRRKMNATVVAPPSAISWTDSGSTAFAGPPSSSSCCPPGGAADSRPGFAGSTVATVHWPACVVGTTEIHLRRDDIPAMQLLAQVNDQFLVGKHTVTDPATQRRMTVIIAVDQHAADERVRLEELLDAAKAARLEAMPLAEPITLAVPNGVAATERADMLARWGFHVEVAESSPSRSTYFPSHRATHVITRAVPTLFADRLTGDAAILRAVLADILAPTASDHAVPPHLLALYQSKACRSAIMFGDVLDDVACRRLLAALAQTAFPFQCAHGRPSLCPVLVMDHGDVEQVQVCKDGEPGRLAPHRAPMLEGGVRRRVAGLRAFCARYVRGDHAHG
ncbi:DNA mismatch repair protein [Allomyces arbusculus]|nr:DNA mismatch repair protein [Allomyces arbusculus]